MNKPSLIFKASSISVYRIAEKLLGNGMVACSEVITHDDSFYLDMDAHDLLVSYLKVIRSYGSSEPCLKSFTPELFLKVMLALKRSKARNKNTLLTGQDVSLIIKELGSVIEWNKLHKEYQNLK